MSDEDITLDPMRRVVIPDAGHTLVPRFPQLAPTAPLASPVNPTPAQPTPSTETKECEDMSEQKGSVTVRLPGGIVFPDQLPDGTLQNPVVMPTPGPAA